MAKVVSIESLCNFCTVNYPLTYVLLLCVILGVYQPAIDLCIQKLKLGDWVHVFPEGKVNMEKEYLRLKWGVGRIIYETYPINMPLIIPMWHEGMDDLLPNYPPYYFRLNTKLTFNFGNPIDLSKTMKEITEKNVDEMEARRMITDEIQKELNVSKYRVKRFPTL